MEEMTKYPARAKYIKNSRRERAWTQSQLADIASLNLRTIQRIEKDGSASSETLMAIAQAFDIEVHELTQITAQKEKDGKVYLMPRMLTGSNLTQIVEGSDQFQLEHDESKDPRYLGAMRDMLMLLRSDVVRLYDADATKRFEIEIELSQAIKDIEKFGFYLFGTKREIPKIEGRKKTKIKMCTIFLSHSQSPKIVQNKDSRMFIPAVLTEVVRSG